jgi:hypothetical protein
LDSLELMVGLAFVGFRDHWEAPRSRCMRDLCWQPEKLS